MRKFIKEISALIASVSVGTAAAALISTASEENAKPVKTSSAPIETTTEIDIPLGGVTVPPDTTTLIMGGMMPPDKTEPDTEEFPPTAGIPMPTDGYIEPTTEEYPPLEGIPMVPDEYIEPTTEEYPPLEGIPMVPDEYIEPTTEEFPPLAGEPLPPDEFIEPTTEEFPPLSGAPLPPDEFIEPTTEEIIPPLAGDVAPPDGDINGDGSFNVADVVSFQKGLLNPDEMPDNWYAADLCFDGELDVFDLVAMKQKLVDTVLSDKQLISSTDIIALSEKGYALTWADLEKFECKDIGSGMYVMEYKLKDMNGRFLFTVGGTDSEIIYAVLETADGNNYIDIREGGDILAFISRYNPPV